MTLSIQFLTMIAMILSGFYLGMARDTFRRFTPHWKGNIFLTYLMEICFWMTQALIVFYVLFRVNSGEIRFYIIIATALGFSMYQVFASTLYKRILERMIRIIFSIYQFIKRVIKVLIIQPIKWVIMVIITVVLAILNALQKVVFFILKLLFSPIRWLLNIIYSILPERFQKYLTDLAGFYSKIKNIISKWFDNFKSKRR